MAKKSHKRPARPKKDNAGCMSGLIGMFDFRQGRFTQKLLPDRKFGSDRHGGKGYICTDICLFLRKEKGNKKICLILTGYWVSNNFWEGFHFIFKMYLL